MKQKLFPLSIRSRNFSCKPLKELLFPIKVIYRMGSQTPTNLITKQRKVLEINQPEACKVSGDKILMKTRFTKAKIPTAEWFVINPLDKDNEKIQYYLNKWKRIIIKHKYSSKGNGIYLIENMEDYLQFLQNKQHKLEDYICERYYKYCKEYRIHVTKKGCFYACRKMLKHDANVRWHRHENNSVWILEDNELFNKPNNWENIVNDCIKALKSLHLDIAAFDVKVQTNTQEIPKYIILESNSAPALGDFGLQQYKKILTTYVNETL